MFATAAILLLSRVATLILGGGGVLRVRLFMWHRLLAQCIRSCCCEILSINRRLLDAEHELCVVAKVEKVGYGVWGIPWIMG